MKKILIIALLFTYKCYGQDAIMHTSWGYKTVPPLKFDSLECIQNEAEYGTIDTTRLFYVTQNIRNSFKDTTIQVMQNMSSMELWIWMLDSNREFKKRNKCKCECLFPSGTWLNNNK